MSRSRKKTPIHGITTARSEKDDKRMAHGKQRAAEKQAITKIMGGEEVPLPLQRETSNPYTFEKDGKMIFDPAEYPKLMRK